MLTHSQVMDLLRSLKTEMAERYRVEELSLFGSMARQEQGQKSDLDLLLDFAESAPCLIWWGWCCSWKKSWAFRWT